MEPIYSDIQPELAERVKRGDRQAQHELYNSYAKAMFHICLRMLQNREDAEDMLHEAFMEVFSRIGSFRGESTLGAWIKRIVVNKCINKLNKKSLFTTAYTEQTEEVPEEQEDHPVWQKLSVNEVKKAMQELPEGFRVIFNLYAFEQYGHKEIAGLLNISESTSKTQYMRAKEKLRHILNTNFLSPSA